MRNGKHGSKALVLGTMAVLGALALAAGAQAQTHEELLSAHATHNASGGVLNPNPLTDGGTVGQFLVNLGAALSATIAVVQEGTGVLLVAGRSIEIKCTGFFLSATINTSKDASGEGTFTGCKTFNHKTLAERPECLLKDLETIKASFLILPILHGGESFLLFEPQTGSTMTTITYKPGIGCDLPLENPVTGFFTALVEELDAVTQTLLFSQGIQLLLGDVLRFGVFPVYYTANGTVELTGSHLGQKLGIH